MYNLNLQEVTGEQTLLIGDAFAAAGHYSDAKNLYQWALTGEQDVALRYRLRLRIGLVSEPNITTAQVMRQMQELEKQYQLTFVGSGLATWYKTPPFMDDERFLALEAKHSELLPLPNWHWNLQTVLWAVQQTTHVEGDLVELGVFKGHTTLFVADYIQFQNSPKRWVLIDTFDGIPDDQLDPGWAPLNESAYKGTFGYDEVVNRFAAFPNIEVIRGRVPDILKERCPERISFLHLDLNNSAAEIAALEFVIDRLSPGAVMVLDDYGWSASRAQYEAERQWFSDRGLHVLTLPTGQGLFIKVG